MNGLLTQLYCKKTDLVLAFCMNGTWIITLKNKSEEYVQLSYQLKTPGIATESSSRRRKDKDASYRKTKLGRLSTTAGRRQGVAQNSWADPQLGSIGERAPVVCPVGCMD